MEYLNNLNSAFKLTKIISIISIFGAFILITVFYFSSQAKIEKSREKIYVLSNGDVLQFALSKNIDENRPAEIKSHVATFSKLFFELDPDPKDIKEKVDKALVLIDNSGQQMHSSRKEKLYYHKIVESSISLRMKIDSTRVDISRYPYGVTVYGKQKFIRPSKITYRNFIADCQIRNVKRTDDNPHGLFIENFKLIDNKIINERSRN